MADFTFFSAQTKNATSPVFTVPAQGLYNVESSGDFDCCKLELQIMITNGENVAEFKTIYSFTEPVMLTLPLEKGNELRMILTQANANTNITAKIVSA